MSRRIIGTGVLASVLLLATWLPASAQAQPHAQAARSAPAANPNPGILPPHAHAYGRTYGAWSAAWWQYVLAQPISSNPLLDTTGADCRQGQSGPVFFLAGSNIGPVTRDKCTVPAGKALFFPLVNSLDVHTPGDGLDTPELLWADLHNFVGPATDLHARIDGVQVSNLNPPATTPYRACAGGPQSLGCAPAFSVTLPADNLNGVPAGTYAPAVADGFYLLLAPLKAGKHTITFGGEFSFAGMPFSQDITYHLMVSAS